MRRRRRPISLSLSLFPPGSRGRLVACPPRLGPSGRGWGLSRLFAVSADSGRDLKHAFGRWALPRRLETRPLTLWPGCGCHRPTSRAVAFRETASRVPSRGVSVMQCSACRRGRVPNTWPCRCLSAAPERHRGLSPVPVWRSLPAVTVVPGLRSRGRGSHVERRDLVQDPGSRRSSCCLTRGVLLRLVCQTSHGQAGQDLECPPTPRGVLGTRATEDADRSPIKMRSSIVQRRPGGV
jgi:hypothetical protein